MFDVSELAIRFAMAVSVGSFLVVSQANAQTDCSIKDIVKASNATNAAADNFKCLFDKIEKLEKEVAPFRNAKGAVIAFDRSGGATADASAGYCPPGWEWFEPSGGRMLIGAGNHQNNLDDHGNRLQRYPSYLEDPKDAVGGEEQHTLTVEEMPSHDHRVPDGQVVSNQNITRVPAANQRTHGMFKPEPPGDRVTSPHNNMPPYIALYFCKKEG